MKHPEPAFAGLKVIFCVNNTDDIVNPLEIKGFETGAKAIPIFIRPCLD